MDELTELLGRQVGPLPVGGWLIAVAGGLGVAWFINRDGGPGPEPAPEYDPGADGGLGLLSRGGSGTDLLGGAMPARPAEGTPDAETNGGWAVRAIQAAISLGFGPLASNIAVSRFLTGQELNADHAALINAVLGEIGPPPNPVPTPRLAPPPRDDGSGGQTPTKPPAGGGSGGSSDPVPTNPPTKPKGTTTTTTPPASGRIYTIVRGDTLWGIATRYYGDGSEWRRIWRANSSVGSDGIGLRSGNPNLIYPGERIRIP